jgi:3-aminobutyryl-CoA ammonia-lyase
MVETAASTAGNGLADVVHRTRVGQQDAHYGGGLVDGARILALFGDAATELMIRADGDEGLLAAYETVQFLSPTHAGDFLEVRARLVSVGRRSRRVELSADRYIEPDPSSESGAVVLTEPVAVCRAVMISVVPAPIA